MGLLHEVVANLPRIPKRDASLQNQSRNPISLMMSLTPMQHLFFLSGWLAWMCDAIDFFAVSLSVSRLVVQFGKPTGTITTSITLTLLFRPLGAVIFGLLSDRFGRKWPLIANLLIVAALSLATGFTNDFNTFLAVRSLFGIGMGGIWGQAASLGLENMPAECRGLYSGILQQGYAVGYLIAAIINLYAVPHYDTWRVLFYIGAGISLGAAVFRLALPESAYFVDRQLAAKSSTTSGQRSKTFLVEAGKAIKTHWLRCLFAVLIMTGFNFFSHGSQDLYPTYINVGKGLGARNATLATIVGNVGAVCGGTFAGYISQYLGRRLTIILCCIWVCVFLPLWLLPTTFNGLAAGAFFVQFGVQGAWGVVPVYLSEISPVAFRAVWPGVAYQLGNMISSASAQIEATAGETLKTANGKPDYGKVSAILIGVVAAWIIALALIGKEDLGAHFENGKAAFEKDSGLDARHNDDLHEGSSDLHQGSIDEEKAVSQTKE